MSNMQAAAAAGAAPAPAQAAALKTVCDLWIAQHHLVRVWPLFTATNPHDPFQLYLLLMSREAMQQGLTLSNDTVVKQLLLYATREQRAGIIKPYPPANMVSQRLDEVAAHLGKFQTTTEVTTVGEEEEELETDTICRKTKEDKQPIRCFKCGKIGHIARQCREGARESVPKGKKHQPQQEGNQFVVCTQIGIPLQHLTIVVCEVHRFMPWWTQALRFR